MHLSGLLSGATSDHQRVLAGVSSWFAVLFVISHVSCATPFPLSRFPAMSHQSVVSIIGSHCLVSYVVVMVDFPVVVVLILCQ